MLNYSLLTDDQHAAIDRMYEHDSTLLVADMGAGKTVCALTAASELLHDGVCKRILVLAPLKVCQSVWQQEAENWSHLGHLNVAKAVGSEKQRRAALDSGAEIVCINFENIPWLFRKYGAKGMFDGLIVDELTKLKEVGGAQFKALRPRLGDFAWRVGMTGTPVSEDWTGLFGQMLVVDSGQRLGTRKDSYLRKYFYPTDFQEYNWELHPWAAEEISKQIKDVVYTLPDYRHELPPLTIDEVVLPLPPHLREKYRELTKSMAVQMDGGGDVVADTAAVLSGKLMQCANGFLYGPRDEHDRPTETYWFSDYKLAALGAQVDLWLEEGEQVVICYWFSADKQRLVDLYGTDALLSPDAIDQWQGGKQPILLLHPRSAGHGLNLAKGGCKMLWLGPVWSRDLFEQTIGRLWRRGQLSAVEVVVLLGGGTIDEMIVARVEGKEEYEVLFKQHLGAG